MVVVVVVTVVVVAGVMYVNVLQVLQVLVLRLIVGCSRGSCSGSSRGSVAVAVSRV